MTASLSLGEKPLEPTISSGQLSGDKILPVLMAIAIKLSVLEKKMGSITRYNLRQVLFPSNLENAYYGNSSVYWARSLDRSNSIILNF